MAGDPEKLMKKQYVKGKLGGMDDPREKPSRRKQGCSRNTSQLVLGRKTMSENEGITPESDEKKGLVCIKSGITPEVEQT
jgi:hypothetical protein